MTTYLLLAAAVIIASVFFNKISSRLGIPTLLVFILLGMLFGSDGLVKIPFADFAFAEQLCSVALIFIMFYGGFGTSWRQARPVAVKSILLSGVGTLITAALVGLFCMTALKISPLESFLIGSVISSTDAASVFSILRSRRLNLKYNTASLLELESGSNDPFSYMLTVVVLSLMNGVSSGADFALMLIAQIVIGVAGGAVIALLTRVLLRHITITAAGFDAIFILGIAIAAYAAPAALGGNGYLAVYIAGIILGNSKIGNKKTLVHFFDGATGLMQMLLFFLLGLLCFPSQLPAVAGTALLIALFLTFVARPLTVFALLSPFRSRLSQMLLVSWSGMRGAASIVFAIMATINPAVTDNDIFHIVFFIVLFSILLQGTLIPPLAKALSMTDEQSDVMKTFTDYADELPVEFIRFTIPEQHAWVGCRINSLADKLPPECILVLLERGEDRRVPNGATVLRAGDRLTLCGRSSGERAGVRLLERSVTPESELAGRKISELPPDDDLIILIRRGSSIVIPRGTTRLKQGDLLVINRAPNAQE